MFQSVEVSNLRYNCKYKIIADSEYVGVYKGRFCLPPDLYLEFDHIHNINGHFQPPKYFLPTRKFYKFISQKARIQSNMERRAVNLIVRRVIGDDCFQW